MSSFFLKPGDVISSMFGGFVTSNSSNLLTILSVENIKKGHYETSGKHVLFFNDEDHVKIIGIFSDHSIYERVMHRASVANCSFVARLKT